MRRSTQRASVDLPQPDSPTRPSVSPAAIAKRDAVHRADDAGARRAPREPSQRRAGSASARRSIGEQGVHSGRGAPAADARCRPLRGLRRWLAPGSGWRTPAGPGAAVGEAAAGWGRQQRGHRAGDRLHRHRAVDAGDGADQGARVGMRGRVEEVAHLGPLHRLARVHHHHAVAQPGDHAEVVGDEEDRGARAPAQVAQQLEDLGGDRDVEPGRRLVGDEQARVGGQRHRDHHALAHAARELMRVLPGPPLGLGDARLAEHGHRALARLPRRRAAVQREQSLDLPADGQHGIERGARALEHHGDLRPAHRAHRLLGHGEQVAPVETDAPADDARGRAQQAQDGHRAHRLARARLADQADHLARRRCGARRRRPPAPRPRRCRSGR